MALSPAERLRKLLGEVIPDDGSDADTLFKDDEIDDLLSSNDGNIDRAAFEGWKQKAAELAALVTTAEGNSTRMMSDLHKNALAMVRQYEGLATGPTAGRTRIGRISRPGGGAL